MIACMIGKGLGSKEKLIENRNKKQKREKIR